MKKLLLLSLLIFSLLATSVFAAIDITTTSLSLTGTPGTAINSQFHISNTEAVAHTISFSGYALTHSSVSSRTMNIDAISSVSLPSGTTNQAVNLVISSTNVYTGTYSGILTATSTTNNALTDTLPVQVVISPVAGATATNPSISAGKGMTQVNNNAFTISNSGNTDLSSISISVNDLTDTANNVLPQQYITFGQVSAINYGSSAQVPITTTVLSTQPSGQYTGQITINYGGSNAATATLTVDVRDPIHDVDITNTEIKLGSSTQERGQSTQTTFNVQNSGDYTESVSVSLTNVDSDYSASLSTTSFTLTPGQQQTITVSATVPDDQNSGTQDLGTIRVDYNNNAESFTMPLKLETVSKLTIEDLDMDVSGQDDDNLNDGDTISEDAKPEEDVKFDFKIKNNFASSSDIEIKDVIVEITIRDIDDGDEIELDHDSFDLDAGDDKDNVDLEFTVPLKVEEGDYTVEIYVEGEDDNDALHIIEWTLTLTVDKDRHNVKITEVRLGTDTLKCVKSTELRVTITNIGSRDQDSAGLVIFNSELGLNINIADISLESDIDDDDNEYTKRITIDLPDDVEAKTYPIEIRAYYSDDIESDKELVNLKVEECSLPAPSTDNSQQDSDTTVIYTQSDTTTPTTTSTTTSTVETVETSFTNSTAFMLILIAANLLIVLAIVILVIKFLI